MKLIDALEDYEEFKKENMGPYKKIKGIKLTGVLGPVLISNEMLDSTDWGVVINNSDPSFVSAVGSMMNLLRGIDKPHLVLAKDEAEDEQSK